MSLAADMYVSAPAAWEFLPRAALAVSIWLPNSLMLPSGRSSQSEVGAWGRVPTTTCQFALEPANVVFSAAHAGAPLPIAPAEVESLAEEVADVPPAVPAAAPEVPAVVAPLAAGLSSPHATSTQQNTARAATGRR